MTLVLAPRAGVAGLIASLAKWGVTLVNSAAPERYDVGRYVLTNPGFGAAGTWTIVGAKPNPPGWVLTPLATGTGLDLPPGVYSVVTSGYIAPSPNCVLSLDSDVPNFVVTSQMSAVPGVPSALALAATIVAPNPWRLRILQGGAACTLFPECTLNVTRLGEAV